MNQPTTIPYYVYFFKQGARKRGEIDFARGLGRFLVNSGVLENRILLENGDELEVEPRFTYRRYVFDPGVRRFVYDLEFCVEDFEEGKLEWKETKKGRTIVSGETVLCSERELGVWNDPADLNVILSKKERY